MHPEMMKPHIPLLAQDQVSSGLHLSQLLRFRVPLIFLCCLCQAFSIQSLQSWKRKQLRFLLLIIEHLLSIIFINLDMEILEYEALPDLTQLWSWRKIFE